jgi:RNA polymerase sigma factor (sigma-70 family)
LRHNKYRQKALVVFETWNYAMSDDQALLLRYVHSRDAVAFAELVKRYSTLVYSIACRVTGNASTAEDVTQDCFFALARHAATIRSSLPAWLHRTALNRSLDFKRSEAIRHRHESQVSPPANLNDEVSWKQIAPLVDESLTKLPDDLREPLVQYFLLGRTQAVVAKNLHVDQGTISRRLLEGVNMLREHLRETGLVCSITALSTVMTKNTVTIVPATLSASLMKIAMAGPAGAKAIGLWGMIKALFLKKMAGVILAASLVTASVSTAIIVMEVNRANEPITKESLIKGLILHFTFAKAAPDGNVTDLSDAKNDGKASGARWTPNGKMGGAYEFKTDGDQIEVANNESLNPKQITLAAWIKTSYMDARWRRIFDKSYDKGYALSIAGDWRNKSYRGLGCLEICPGTHVAYSNIVVADGQWHHLVATFDENEQRLYVDGQIHNAIRWKKPGQLNTNNFNLVIGCNRSNLQEDDLGISFRGLIDEPMVWNRALSPEEVKFLFESQQ